MGNVLSNLEPTALWKNFEDICGIPHPSKHEEKLREHVLAWAKAHNIESSVDEVGNVIMRKPATPGMEDRKGIILQAHLDMVPQKNSDTNHDFLTDPIKPVLTGSGSRQQAQRLAQTMVSEWLQRWPCLKRPILFTDHWKCFLPLMKRPE